MKALLQRVAGANVTVDGEEVGRIGPGLAVMAGIAADDTEKDIDFLANKIANLRIFSDQAGKFNLSALDTGAEVLVVSQFTLLADTRKGRRPSFESAAPPERAAALIPRFVRGLEAAGLKVSVGRFQAHMLVEIHNDGPVTIMLDSRSAAGAGGGQR